MHYFFRSLPFRFEQYTAWRHDSSWFAIVWIYCSHDHGYYSQFRKCSWNLVLDWSLSFRTLGDDRCALSFSLCSLFYNYLEYIRHKLYLCWRCSGSFIDWKLLVYTRPHMRYFVVARLLPRVCKTRPDCFLASLLFLMKREINEQNKNCLDFYLDSFVCGLCQQKQTKLDWIRNFEPKKKQLLLLIFSKNYVKANVLSDQVTLFRSKKVGVNW